MIGLYWPALPPPPARPPKCYRCGLRVAGVAWVELAEGWRYTDAASVTWHTAWLCPSCQADMAAGAAR